MVYTVAPFPVPLFTAPEVCPSKDTLLLTLLPLAAFRAAAWLMALAAYCFPLLLPIALLTRLTVGKHDDHTVAVGTSIPLEDVVRRG